MASSIPPRRFKVEPVETSTKSSKDRHQEKVESSKPARRFAPVPVETTSKSNRTFNPEPVETTSRTNRTFKPEPIETTSRTNRSFKPEPIETTSRTSRSFKPEPIETTKKIVRRFAPEPVETSVRGSGKKFDDEWDNETTRTFRPEPVESSARNNRKPRPQKRPPRKFSPQLIETAQRSRKAGDSAPTLMPSDKTEALPVDGVLSSKKARILGITPPPPENTPVVEVCHNPLFLEIQRATSSFPRPRPYSRSSHHSFRVPDLDPIASSESEGSTPPSPTTSPSLVSDHSFMYKEATRMRESVDDRVSGYLLELAAKAAEKQLREQAMAAFPNSDFHEPVDHFIDHETDDSGSFAEDTKRRRESSFTEVNWELVAMQQHRQRQEEAEKAKNKSAVETNKAPGPIKAAYNPWGNQYSAAPRNIARDQKDPELERMRKDARPPMLGRNIKFPRCASPEPARFDPTQGCDAVKLAMCYLNEQSQAAEKGEGLWCGSGNGKQSSKTPSLWSNASSRPPSRNGLWGGFCIDSGSNSPRGPTGLLTPNHEKSNPLETPCPTPAMSLLPPTPPASTADFACIDEKLAVEQSIEEEFGDDFVTQVYNYLSLGYPSMARPFDEELSKISGISISELRQDDHLAKSRGYIRLGKDGNLTDTEITEESCVRWRALRVYVQEWGRQHPKMAEDPMGGKGAAIRKGSWGL